MKSLADAVADFESETAVERLLFLELDARPDGGADADPSTLRMAGVRIAEAAERLLRVLDEGATAGQVSAVAGEPRLAH